jgi:hypothetical protein
MPPFAGFAMRAASAKGGGMSPWRPARTCRRRIALLAVLALLLQAASPPAWMPGRDDPFMLLAGQMLGGLCGPGRGDPGIPPTSHDHATCPACQPGPVPLLAPPEPPCLPAPVLVAAAGSATAPAARVPRPASPYASRAPPQDPG